MMRVFYDTYPIVLQSYKYQKTAMTGDIVI